MPMSPRLLRPRAVVTFDPRTISNLLAWYDASDTASLFSDDAATSRVTADAQVAVWNDKSGNAYHLTQRTANNRPLWRQDFVNGRPAIDFDGSNDSLATRDSSNNLTFPFNLASSKTLSFVGVSIGDTVTSLKLFSFKRNNIPDYTSGLAFYAETAGAGRFDLVFGRGDGGVSPFAGRTYAQSPTSWHIASGSITTSEIASRHNGASQSLSVLASGTINISDWLSQGTGNHNLCVGARGFSSNNTLGAFNDGKVAELMFFGRALTAAEFLAIERYLSGKYGILLA